jgi:UDP-N-acetylmuramyl pentapeptide phosphotransferase/UDP-N-acetylglucosamine-1-phosphate transferase
VDDAPRIGGAQALFLIIGVTAAYVTVASGWWFAALLAAGSFAMVGWLELYARRRVREEREAMEARFARASIAHLDFDDEPFDTSRDE